MKAEEFVLKICQGEVGTEELEKLKRAAAKVGDKKCFTNISLLAAYRRLVESGRIEPDERFLKLFQKQKSRTLSGVAVVAVLTKPAPCPGECLYCPTESGMPKSYFSDEPAVMRAVLCQFDPYRQVQGRLASLRMTGHVIDKVELIIMGGTFTSLPRDYQEWFTRRCFEALNSFGSKAVATEDLKEAQRVNETAQNRCVGLTLETRPDEITPEVVKWMRVLGATRVEMGVQNINDSILKLNRRGHGVAESIRATRLLKEAGFKINYHLMPGLPGATLESDLAMFAEIFSNPDFCPDMIKLYPCLITRDCELAEWYKDGRYKPYSEEEIVDLVCRIKKDLPEWVRIMRLGRDIPETDVVAGWKNSNLRQAAQVEMKKRGWQCRCIRCREVREESVDWQQARLVKREYEASGGREIFLSYEVKNKLLALLRLRLPKGNDLGWPVLIEAALIREVHTFGEELPIGKDKKQYQHRGLGKNLIEEAELMAQKAGYKKMVVIAGVGTRQYYRKFGYRMQKGYMMKVVNKKNETGIHQSQTSFISSPSFE